MFELYIYIPAWCIYIDMATGYTSDDWNTNIAHVVSPDFNKLIYFYFEFSQYPLAPSIIGWTMGSPLYISFVLASKQVYLVSLMVFYIY